MLDKILGLLSGAVSGLVLFVSKVFSWIFSRQGLKAGDIMSLVSALVGGFIALCSKGLGILQAKSLSKLGHLFMDHLGGFLMFMYLILAIVCGLMGYSFELVDSGVAETLESVVDEPEAPSGPDSPSDPDPDVGVPGQEVSSCKESGWELPIVFTAQVTLYTAYIMGSCIYYSISWWW